MSRTRAQLLGSITQGMCEFLGEYPNSQALIEQFVSDLHAAFRRGEHNGRCARACGGSAASRAGSHLRLVGPATPTKPERCAVNSDDIVIVNRTGPDVRGGFVEVYEVTGPQIAPRQHMLTTLPDATEVAKRYAKERRVSVWREPDPQSDAAVLVESYRS